MEQNDDLSHAGSVGSSFDDFLREQGTEKETTAQAIERMRAHEENQSHLMS